jgi:thymidylate kinase
MIVEFIGSSGAGKTTLAQMLQRRGDMAHPVVSTVDLVVDRPGRRWIKDPKAINVVADVTALPSFIRGWRHDREFVRFAYHRLRRHAPSTFARFNYLREIVRNVGLHELARRAAGGATILADEGTVLTASHLFVYSDGRLDQAEIERFARLVPLPDRIVYVKAPLDALLERAMRRPDPRRELPADDRRQIEGWIARSQEVFDRLTETPAIRDRLLIVENPSGAPDAQRAAVERIAAFIDGRAPAGRGAVIAFVGSEATGKSTILNEVDDWLRVDHTVRRIHAGKPPATALTSIPHHLLPALRALFPNQRSTRVEASYAAERPRGETYPLMFAVRSVMLAYERRALLSSASALSANGAIVLSDRYPSSRSGAPDSPQLGHLPTPSGRFSVRRQLAALEARLYRDIPEPDLVIYLTAPLEVTLFRNAARDKTEDEDFVRLRHSLSSHLEFEGTVVHRIDTDQPLEIVLKEVKEVIQDAL